MLLRANVSANIIGVDRMPPTIDRLVTDSDVIAEVKLTSVAYVIRPEDQNDYDPAVVHGGTYTFSLIKPIRGSIGTVNAFDFPALYGFPYAFSLNPPHVGDALLLFLKRQGTGFVATSNVTPYYPITIPTDPRTSTVSDRDAVLSDLCNTLQDSRFRRIISNALKWVVSPNVVVAMAKYIDDPDLQIKDDALSCMAKNSQLSAIPMIVKFAEGRRATWSVNTLSLYTTPDAVPYLNPLLWNNSPAVRASALRALRTSADKSSAPYLIIALRDPTPDHSVSVSARAVLALRIMKLQHPYERDKQFIANFDVDVKEFYNWWSDELSGKHLASDDPDAAQKQEKLESQSIPTDIQDINPLLFEPYPILRERASAALLQKADRSSIPYLVLALQDPDGKVSYNAYLTLRRLLGVPSAPLSKDDYIAGQDAATKPLYAWWSDELLGKHSKVLPFAPISPDLLRSLPTPKS
jgi:hypothetical protein